MSRAGHSVISFIFYESSYSSAMHLNKCITKTRMMHFRKLEYYLASPTVFSIASEWRLCDLILLTLHRLYYGLIHRQSNRVHRYDDDASPVDCRRIVFQLFRHYALGSNWRFGYIGLSHENRIVAILQSRTETIIDLLTAFTKNILLN